jgi:hypothetical protein
MVGSLPGRTVETAAAEKSAADLAWFGTMFVCLFE